MKNLSLLMFVILILGCGTETPVVEQPPPVIEEPNVDLAEIQAIADQLSQAAESLDILVPVITESSVADGATNVDPEPLNRDGVLITFSERISLSHFNLIHEEGYSLNWKTEWHPDGQAVKLTPPNPCDRLNNGTTYVIDFVVQDFSSWKTEGTITFTTEPAVPAAPALDFQPAFIESINIKEWIDVDPEWLNRHGINIVFDSNIAESDFDLTLIAFNHDLKTVDVLEWASRLRDGLPLGWIAEWRNPRTVKLTPPPYACSMLQKGATYHLDMYLLGYHCIGGESKNLTFFTKRE